MGDLCGRDFGVDHCHGLLERLCIGINEGNGCPFPAKQQSTGLTDACCAARDQR
jgi:hypothetical protein